MEPISILNAPREKTVAEIVAQDYRTADVFKKYGIDFCCGGKVPLSELCFEKNIDLQKITAELENVQKNEGLPSMNFYRWPLSFLCDFIIQIHHSYVKESIPVIEQFAAKVAKVHGVNHPETITIAELFTDVKNELMPHMQKEERILFPYIKQIVTASENKTQLQPPHFGTIANPIRLMESEHELAGSLMKQIEELSGEFTPPADACNTYRVLYLKLKEFQNDLHQHIHLENNIVFPKALLLESENN